MTFLVAVAGTSGYSGGELVFSDSRNSVTSGNLLYSCTEGRELELQTLKV